MAQATEGDVPAQRFGKARIAIPVQEPALFLYRSLLLHVPPRADLQTAANPAQLLSRIWIRLRAANLAAHRWLRPFRLRALEKHGRNGGDRNLRFAFHTGNFHYTSARTVAPPTEENNPFTG